MTRIAIIVLALMTLVACGVDGAPVAPSDQPGPGVSVTGDVEIGMVSEL